MEKTFKKRRMRTSIVIVLFILISPKIFSQINSSFCKAVENSRFKIVERIFKREIKKRRNGTPYYNGPGSGMQITHQYNIDTLTKWLINKPCIEDAYWDKCQIKISIYPGWIIIGAIFKTKKGLQEKCFYIQEGTMGSIKIFKWRFPFLKMTNKLVYKKMYDQPGFIEQQKKNCVDINKE